MGLSLARTSIELEVQGKKYEMILDFESAIEFEAKRGYSIFTGVNKVTQAKSMTDLAYLIACITRDDTGKMVGLDFVKNMDIISNMAYLTEMLTELVTKSLPEATEEDKKGKADEKKKKGN